MANGRKESRCFRRRDYKNIKRKGKTFLFFFDFHKFLTTTCQFLTSFFYPYGTYRSYFYHKCTLTPESLACIYRSLYFFEKSTFSLYCFTRSSRTSSRTSLTHSFAWIYWWFQAYSRYTFLCISSDSPFWICL